MLLFITWCCCLVDGWFDCLELIVFCLVNGWIVAFAYCDCWYCLICMFVCCVNWFGLGLYTLRVVVLLVGLVWLWMFGFCYVF